MFVDIIKLFVL